MRTHVRRLSRAAVLVMLVAVGFGTVIGAAGGASLGSTTFTDPAGDAPGAPDVTAVAVSDSGEIVQVAVTAGGLEIGTGVIVFLDTDANASTGLEGVDYGLSVDHDGDGLWWDVLHWNGSTFVSMPATPSMGFSRSGDTYTVRVSRSDLGNPTALSFGVLASAYDANDDIVAADRAPDSGDWVYQLTRSTPPITPTPPVPTVTPLIGKAKTTPVTVVAGKRVTVTFPLARKEDGSKLTGATMTCDPKVGPRMLAHTESIGTGVARLSFVVPRSATGKTLKVNLTVRVGGTAAHTVATFRVK